MFDVAKLTYFGLFALQHRGQEAAGIAVSNGNNIEDLYLRRSDLKYLDKKFSMKSLHDLNTLTFSFLAKKI